MSGTNGIIHGGSDFTGSMGLVMTSFGHTQITRDGIHFQELARSPNPFNNGGQDCLVVVDDNKIFLAGGDYPGSDVAYMYDKLSNSWRELQSMMRKRRGHSCGLIENNNSKEIVVAGGLWDYNPNSIYPWDDTVEIFSEDTETWRWGNNFMYKTRWITHIQWAVGENVLGLILLWKILGVRRFKGVEIVLVAHCQIKKFIFLLGSSVKTITTC